MMTNAYDISEIVNQVLKIRFHCPCMHNLAMIKLYNLNTYFNTITGKAYAKFIAPMVIYISKICI